MIPNIKIKVTEGVIKSFNRIVNWVNLSVPQLTFDAAHEGAEYARLIAPKDTRALHNAIGTGEGGFAIVSRLPKAQKNRSGALRAIPRPYHAFMHGIGGYDTSAQIRSGEPRYMFKTFEMISKKYPDDLSNSLKREIQKN